MCIWKCFSLTKVYKKIVSLRPPHKKVKALDHLCWQLFRFLPSLLVYEHLNNMDLIDKDGFYE